MDGIIYAYSTAASGGLIVGTDGQRYTFSNIEWAGTSMPVRNQPVIFDSSSRQARQVRDKNASAAK